MKKEKWIDDMRAIACILVAFGHLFNGSIEIYSLNADVFMLLNSLFYKIHVPIFFFCSGYLFQNRFKHANQEGYISYTLQKIVNLGVPYVLFCLLTFFIKVLFPSAVNTQMNESIVKSLFVLPPNQMWFLFVLIVCFFITPVGIKNKYHAIVLSIIGCMMLVAYRVIGNRDFVFYKILDFYIWFVLGMLIHYFGIEKIRIKNEWILGVLFFLIFLLNYYYNFLGIFDVTITFFGIIWIMLLCRNKLQDKKTRILSWISKYMLQIYLLHTIFAVAIRIVLRRIGVINGYVHLAIGLVGCMGASILVAIICEKLIYPNVVFFPIKTIKQIKERWRK